MHPYLHTYYIPTYLPAYIPAYLSKLEIVKPSRLLQYVGAIRSNPCDKAVLTAYATTHTTLAGVQPFAQNPKGPKSYRPRPEP